MFRLPTLVLFCVAVTCVFGSWAQNGPTVFHVAQDGNDTNPGTAGKPFTTLEAARKAVMAHLAGQGPGEQGIRILVKGGEYGFTAPLVLDKTCSGAPGAPVRFEAYGDKPARLIGGKVVTGFAPVTDEAALKRLPEKARGKVLQTDLRAQGITDFGTMRPRGMGRPGAPSCLELFLDGEPMQIARWPNDDWAIIADTPAGKDGGRFAYAGDRPSSWLEAEDLWLHGYWTQDWADSYVKVASIDVDKRLIITEEPHGVYGYTKGKRFYALNLIEELDAPGEYYLDRAAGILYFWPPRPIKENGAVVSVLNSIISMEETSYVEFVGFVVEACRGTAITIKGGEHNLIGGCVIRNTGQRAVNISGGTHNGVRGCDIYNADSGVGLQGGDRKTLTPCHNYALNNHIHDFGRWCRTYRPGVACSGVGIRVAHNHIHAGPHNGIQLGGNDNIIEYNELNDLCRETGDVGAFYMGRDWTTRGNIIRFNYFHDLHGPYTHGAMAVYLDDAASGTLIHGNVFYRASRAAFIGGGRDNVVENNVFVECNPGVHIDSRGLGWAKKYIAKGGAWQMYKKLKAVSFDKPPYSVRYRGLVNILDDDPPVPKGNVIARNVFLGGKHMSLSDEGRKFATIVDNFEEGDPGFVDASNGDFRLKADSPVFKLEFRAIPIDKIGLMSSPYRKRIPKVD